MRPWGKHVSVEYGKPNGLGICDYTGFVFNHRDLVKQMEWRGNRLVWTGFLVGRPYADKPNEQLRPPQPYFDPVPLTNPRPPQGDIITYSLIQGPVWGQLQVVSWTSWGNYQTLSIVNLIGNNTELEFGPDENDGIAALPEDERYQELQQVWFGG